MKSPLIVVLVAILSLLASALHVPICAQEKTAEATTDWGTVTDPGNDCEFNTTIEKLSITVPATNHDLTPDAGQKAPRVLKKVSGAFTVQVKVTADFMPGKKSVGKNRPFNGAGILIWQDEKNYLRIERNAYWIDQQILNCYPPLIAYWNNNQQIQEINTNPTTANFFQGKSTWLRANRQGPNVTVSISHDGKTWTEMKRFRVNLADQLMVGVAAVNTSNQPFAVDFEEFTINGK